MRVSVAFLSFAALVSAQDLPSNCDVTAQTEYGPVCGKTRPAANGDRYASFRGMRYAKAPLAELRFAEPQKPEAHDDTFDASESGPICPQFDPIYGPILQPRSMDEDCLRINVHVPSSSLPDPGSNGTGSLLPVFVFIHGGSFNYGSGDTDLQGPEYLMAGKGVILVTFNYRLAFFGFLSLYSKEIPGNAGLRDAAFALQWVQDNIQNFGGDPAEVTLGGQSAGASMVHLLALSPALKEKRLFKRLIALSGSGIAGFFSPSKTYSKFITTSYLVAAGINILQSEAGIHRALIKAPIDKLIKANKCILDIVGLVTFAPVIEDPEEGFTTIIPKDPELLVNEGFAKDYPLWLGFTNNEAQLFKPRLEEVNIETTFRLAPFLTNPMNIVWAAKLLSIPVLTAKMTNRYFNNTLITLEKFIPACTDGYYKYTAMRLAQKRVTMSAEPTYLSEFAHHSPDDIFKRVQNRDWPGAGHCEDLTYFFRVNSILGEMEEDELTQDNEDSRMRNWMTDFVAQFVKTGSPVPENEASNWPPTTNELGFQNITTPQLDFRPPTAYMQDVKKFFDKLNKIGRNM